MDEKDFVAYKRKTDKEIGDLHALVKGLSKSIETRIQTFAPVSGTPTNNGYIPMIIDGKRHKVATVA